MRLAYFIIVTIAAAALLATPALASPGDVFSISGQVLDRYGNPVHGANVTLLDNSYKTIGVKYTNENGNYDFVNVRSDTDTVTVRVNVTRNGTTYDIPSYYTRWYPAKGISFIPPNETRFPNYPAPVYGYLYGAIQTGEGNTANFIPGIVYLVSLDNDVKYYQFADRGDGKASYTFYAPPGRYMLYAQHRENGMVYESPHRAVNITPNGDITEVLETRIVLPLNTPAANPDPAQAPSPQANTVSGTLVDLNNKPVQGVTVALYQRSDNGSTFLPLAINGVPVTAVTDARGRYEFRGAAPMTDDGKAIQVKKGIVAMAGNATTEEKPLYYPDIIMGYGKEASARNVTFDPLALNMKGSVQVGDVTPTPVPPSVPVAWGPLLGALALGILCLAGLYLILKGKDH